MRFAEIVPLLQGSVVDNLPIMTVIIPAAAVVLVMGLLAFFASRYRRCPANRVLVISGQVGGEGSAPRVGSRSAWSSP